MDYEYYHDDEDLEEAEPSYTPPPASQKIVKVQRCEN